MKHFGEKEAWAYPGTAQFFSGTPYYDLRNGKSYGFQIWPVYSEGPSEQNEIKNFGKKGAWAYPGTAQFFPGIPLLSQEREKLRISNLASTFRGSIRSPNKSPLKILEKSERWRIQGLCNFFGYPVLSQERVKRRNSNFACTFFIGSIGITKAR